MGGKAVRKSESITAEEAKKMNVIDYISADIDKLLAMIDGRELHWKAGRK